MRSIRFSLPAGILFCSVCFSAFAGIMHIHPGMNMEILTEQETDITDLQEQQFQEFIDRLLNSADAAIDTTGWCSYRINVDRFDYRELTDTLHILLVDSSKNRLFTYPLKNFVTSPFGLRRKFWHFGIDIKANYRDTIRCAFDGIVRVVLNDRNGYGKVVVVRHHFGIETLYGHLSSTKVTTNQEVKSGDVIGLGGRTGRATGNHLHLEMRFCGVPFDPAYLLDVENYSLKCDTFAFSRSTFEYIGKARKTPVHKVVPGNNQRRTTAVNAQHTPQHHVDNHFTNRRKLIVRQEVTP